MNPFVILVVKYVLPVLAWLISLFVPGRRAAVAWREAKNKAWIMELVNNIEKLLASQGTDRPLRELVDLCYRMGTFPALWAVEGLGNFWAEKFRREGRPLKALLTDASLVDLPDGSMTMLHAGIGLCFAKRSLEGLTAESPQDQLRNALRKFIELVDGSSRPGYAGCAYESLGLVTLVLHTPEMARALDTILAGINPVVATYMWRGAGRALYFHPKNFIPGIKCPWRGIGMSREIAPHETARRNLRAGIAWATTVVNMRNPEIMETVLRYQGESDPEREEFVNGVQCSMIMRYDTSPDDPYIRSFIDHVPSGDTGLAKLWERDIRKTCDLAVSKVHPVLKRKQKLEEVFHFQSLSTLMEKLQSA
jgi:hypothetical protein